MSKHLSDIAEIIMGQSPDGSSCGPNVLGMPLLNGPTEFGSHHPTPKQYTTDPKRVAINGDLLFCVRGSTTGRMNWADQKYAIGRGVAAIRHKTDRQLQVYLRGIIEWQLSELLQSATGSTFPNVTGNQIGSLLVPEHTQTEQKAIAHILGSLDDKIELNRRMNETLEAMARAIFKDWFVDFGPTRAKIEGRAPYLPEPIWSLFPDAIDPQSGLPVGWELGRFEELASAKQGKYLSKDKISTISTSEYPYPVWGGNGILGFSKTYIYKEKMILITCRGSNCGLIRKTSSESWISNNSFAVKPRLGSYFFLYIYFLFEDFRDCISGWVMGTKFSRPI